MSILWPEGEQRDRKLKLKLYSAHGVRIYWIVDWKREQVEVYERQGARLELVQTLRAEDTRQSALLPGFKFAIARLFK